MELLSPAGNLEKLKTSVRFGADAVYCGAGSFSLRAPETAFSLDDLAEGINFAHLHGCKVYLALNVFPFDEDLDAMKEYFKEAAKLGIDAVIVSDPGVVSLVQSCDAGIKIHLSTQANTTNSESTRFWRNQGVDRIVLARELSLDHVALIRKNVPDIELEVFVHGAMCVAYSGRCLLSRVMSNRSANQGLCTQPCRWEYQMRETSRSENFTVSEDEHGSYILNSRDLCMIEHIPLLAAAGVDSIKIEGRMKTTYYVAATTRVYRAALNSFETLGSSYRFNPEWLAELTRVSHRPYTTGFYLSDPDVGTEYTKDSSYIRGYDFVGTVESDDPEHGFLKIKARNRFVVGDELEFLDPQYDQIIRLRVDMIKDCKTGAYIKAAHNGYIVEITAVRIKGYPISPEAIIRRKLEL
ncbi:MAG: U32 family peptidase [Firmicutes bacterium]|nr:U32 family peptidase [Bacillota bacterium]